MIGLVLYLSQTFNGNKTENTNLSYKEVALFGLMN